MPDFSVLRFNLEFAKTLAEYENENSEPDGTYKLLWALFTNFAEAVEEELEKGIDVNQIFRCGNSALHIACHDTYNSRIIRAILKCRPMMNIRNRGLQTPLNIFIKRRYFDIDILGIMFEMGADPNIPDSMGNTPLHYLTSYVPNNLDHFKNYVDLFMKHNSNLNSKNNRGDTPLHLAVRGGFEFFVELLLANGAVICIKNAINETVVQIAYRNRKMYSGVFDLIMKEAIMLGCHRILLSEEHHEVFNEKENLKILEEKCNEKLLELKRVKIGNSIVSVYDVLTSSTHKLAKYLRNEEIVMWLKNYDKVACGILQKCLVQRLRMGMERMEAVKIGYPHIHKAFVGLPVLCLEEIISFLSNEDLNNLKFALEYRETSSN